MNCVPTRGGWEEGIEAPFASAFEGAYDSENDEFISKLDSFAVSHQGGGSPNSTCRLKRGSQVIRGQSERAAADREPAHRHRAGLHRGRADQNSNSRTHHVGAIVVRRPQRSSGRRASRMRSDLLIGVSLRPNISSAVTETDVRLDRARAVFHVMRWATIPNAASSCSSSKSS
jgi:hypothetical protein